MTQRDSTLRQLPRGRWLAWLVLACAFRVALPLAALAAAGHSLPGQPRYVFDATPGDAEGFYSAARELMAAWGRLGPVILVLVALGVLVAAFAVVKLCRRGRTELAVVVGAAACGLAVTAAITQTSRHTGGTVIGWPLVWSIPMLPYRALGFPLDPRIAFGFGLVVSLLAIVVTTVSTWLIGLRTTGSRAVAGLAVGLFAFWPLLSRPLGGPGAWQNGTWNVDVGLHMYNEPVSTALVAVAIVLLLESSLTPVVLAVAGVLLSLSVATRLSNGLLAALALVLVAWRVRKRAVWLLLGLVTFAPVAAAWWPRGYAAVNGRHHGTGRPDFAAAYVRSSWAHSLLYTPRLLAVLVPLAVVGVVVVRWAYARALLGGVVLVSAIFYSFYVGTPLHPRYLYVTFPALFTLWAAGVVALVRACAIRLRARGRAGPRLARPVGFAHRG